MPACLRAACSAAALRHAWRVALTFADRPLTLLLYLVPVSKACLCLLVPPTYLEGGINSSMHRRSLPPLSLQLAQALSCCCCAPLPPFLCETPHLPACARVPPVTATECLPSSHPPPMAPRAAPLVPASRPQPPAARRPQHTARHVHKSRRAAARAALTVAAPPAAAACCWPHSLLCDAPAHSFLGPCAWLHCRCVM